MYANYNDRSRMFKTVDGEESSDVNKAELFDKASKLPEIEAFKAKFVFNIAGHKST